METVVVVTTTKTVLLPCMGPVGIGICIAGAIGAIAIPLIVSAVQSEPSQASATQSRNQGHVTGDNGLRQESSFVSAETGRGGNVNNSVGIIEAKSLNKKNGGLVSYDTYKKNCQNNKNNTQTDSRGSAAIVRDPDSSSNDRDPSSNSSVKDPAKHFRDRIIRFFRLSPLVHEVADTLKIPKGDVLVDKTTHQDRSTRYGPQFPAAHVVALGISDKVSPYKHLGCVIVLTNFLAHTQEVEWFANNKIVGRQIDAMQRELYESIIDIDFSGTFTEEKKLQINNILNKFREMLRQCIGHANVKEKEREAYEEALKIVQEITAKDVFEKTKEFYDNDMEVYRNARRQGRH